MIAPKKVSVLIVHHEPVTRLGLSTLVRSKGAFEVIGETGEAPVALRLFGELSPDMVVLSLTLHHGDGISLLRDFRKMNRSARTLVVTAREDALSLQRALKAGARGYVVTEDESDEILHALEQIAAGELYVSARVECRLVRMLAAGSIEIQRERCANLSDRELEVFRLIGSGFGTSRVAKELHLSVKTIETHRQHIREKLGMANGMELTRQAADWMRSAVYRRNKHNSLVSLTTLVSLASSF